VTENGTTYYPHVGEEVWFLGAPSVTFIQNSLRFQLLAVLAVKEGGAFIDLDELSEWGVVLDAVRTELTKHIVSWTWTDLHDAPLDSPSADSLLAIPIGELLWLMNAFQAGLE